MKHLFRRETAWLDETSVAMAANLLSVTPASYRIDVHWDDSGFKSSLIKHLADHCNIRQFVDVGANVGQTLLEIAGLGLDIEYYGFEPNPDAFACLQELADIVSIDCQLHPWACGSISSPASLYECSKTDDSATIIPSIRPDTYLGRHPRWIARYTLDQSINLDKLTTSFLLKIDVEGSELEVLQGATQIMKYKKPIIFCEVLHAHTHSEIGMNNARKGLIEALLADQGYELFRINLVPSDRSTFQSLSKITNLPRNVIWKDSPHTCDYLFAPNDYCLSEGLFDVIP